MVPYSKRSESKLLVVDKARELAIHTIHICNNEKHFPKRYRWCLTNKIVECVLAISNYCEMANSVYVQTNEDYLLRRKYQTLALAETYALYNMIEISKVVFGIEVGKATYWAELVANLQGLIRNWKKSEKKP